MSGKGFRDLIVWKKAKDIAVFIYQSTNTGGINKDYGLRDQIRKAAISIPSNIAEGDERETDKEAVRFFYIAKGSAAEVLTQAIIAFEIGYIKEEAFEEIKQRCTEISAMLSKLISARSKTFRP